MFSCSPPARFDSSAVLLNVRTSTHPRGHFTTALSAGLAAALLFCVHPERAAARTVVRIFDDAFVYALPGGPRLRDAGRLVTTHGSAWVVERRGQWLGIPTTHRKGGGLGWIRMTRYRRLTTTRLLVRVDLSDRRVRVTRGARRLMSAPVTVGAPRSPSPTGLTSVSARIPTGGDSGLSVRGYGPIVIALRLRQRSPSPAFPTGGTMAFHGGSGSRSGTAGCFRLSNRDVLRLARFVRAGTPVIVER